MSLELLKASYPPCVITAENGLAYYETLDQWINYGETEHLVQFIIDGVIEGFKPYKLVLGI